MTLDRIVAIFGTLLLVPISASSDVHAPENAVNALTTHPELKVELFASEPFLTSPSAIDVDAKGRVWVCDVVNYRNNQGKREGGDRILILEDTTGDGRADLTTTFYQGHDIDSAHGICVMGNRVLVSAGDDMFYLIDQDEDGTADQKQFLFSKIGGAQHDHGVHAAHFGPDGKLYFNFGNAGKQLCDWKGNPITDLAGNLANSEKRPYQQGMIFRCDPDGSEVETLAWNFRNNWELAVDSFGGIWQSDNDDDGNRATRINYVLPHGNYGYRDERTSEGWDAPRPNREQEIPDRHWHTNDPGVVPNLLNTGAGSPTGICIYEGNLLPPIFHNQPIHCDAGTNVVRAYITKPEKSGFTAEIVELLKSSENQWFRPSDVCVAPDGTLFVADWYDPGVGGHGMEDTERGRIFRITPKHHNGYHIPYLDLSPTGAINALDSPNEATRYLAFSALRNNFSESIPLLLEILKEEQLKPTLRARAFWVLWAPDITPETSAEALTAAAGSGNNDLAVAAVRAWGMYSHRAAETPDNYVLTLSHILSANRSLPVRREIAVALRFIKGQEAADLWKSLALEHEEGDRWSLEALGIGADLHWDSRLAKIEQPSPDIIWRSRSNSRTADLVTAQLLAAPQDTPLRYFRTLDFIPDQKEKTRALTKLFNEGEDEIALIAAGQLGRNAIQQIDNGEKRLDALLAPLRDSPKIVEIGTRLQLQGIAPELASYIATNPDSPTALEAAKLLLSNFAEIQSLFDSAIASKDVASVIPLALTLGKVGNQSAVNALGAQLDIKAPDSELKPAALQALTFSTRGSNWLVYQAEKGSLDPKLRDETALALAANPDINLRNKAKKLLPLPSAPVGEIVPSAILALKGDPEAGKSAFTKAACTACHQIGDLGINFGPNLSQIGGKLAPEALLESILEPEKAISNGFEGIQIQAGPDNYIGFATSETDTQLTLRTAAGTEVAIEKSAINHRLDLPHSLMPTGLAALLSPQELADLLAYLHSLK